MNVACAFWQPCRQRRWVVLVAFGLWQQSGQLAHLRGRHNAHLVEDGVDQHVALLEEDAVVEKRGVLADGFFTQIFRGVIGEGRVGSAGVVEYGGFDLEVEVATIVADVGRFLQTLESALLQDGNVGLISGGRVVASEDCAFRVPSAEVGWQDARRRCDGRSRG